MTRPCGDQIRRQGFQKQACLKRAATAFLRCLGRAACRAGALPAGCHVKSWGPVAPLAGSGGLPAPRIALQGQPAKPPAVEKGLFLGRGGAAEHGVAVGKAAEPADDVGMVVRPISSSWHRRPAIKRHAAFLVGQIFRMHRTADRKNCAQPRRHLLVEAARRPARRGHRERHRSAANRCAAIAAEHVARELIEHDDQARARFGVVSQSGEPPAAAAS